MRYHDIHRHRHRHKHSVQMLLSKVALLARYTIACRHAADDAGALAHAGARARGRLVRVRAQGVTLLRNFSTGDAIYANVLAMIALESLIKDLAGAFELLLLLCRALQDNILKSSQHGEFYIVNILGH
jgi:hypothetical protein